jgi:O-antigen ligase
MWPLRTFLYFAFFCVACAASLVNPIWGVVNYMVVYQTDPTTTWWGKPAAELGIRFSLVAAAFTILGLFTGKSHVPRAPYSLTWWHAGLAGLFGLAVMNMFLGAEYGASAEHAFNKMWKVLLFAVILAHLAASRQNFNIILWTLVTGCAYIGFTAYTAPEDAFVLGRLNQLGATDFSTTSGAAAFLAAMLPLIGVAFLCTESWCARGLAAAAGALAVNAVILCRTRGAFLGLLLGLLVAFLAAPRARRFRIHVLLIAGAAATFALTDENFWIRMNTLTSSESLEEDPAAMSRKEIWLASVHILADHPFGVGLGNFNEVIGDYAPQHKGRSAHNSVIVVFVELGIPGGMIFLALVAGALHYLRGVARLADQTSDPLTTRYMAYGLLISLVTYFVASLGTQRFDCESYWWVLILPLSLFRLVHAEARAQLCAAVDGPKHEQVYDTVETGGAEPAPATGFAHGM